MLLMKTIDNVYETLCDMLSWIDQIDSSNLLLLELVSFKWKFIFHKWHEYYFSIYYIFMHPGYDSVLILMLSRHVCYF